MATDEHNAHARPARCAAAISTEVAPRPRAHVLFATLAAIFVAVTSGCAFFKDPGPLSPGGFLAEIQDRGELRVGVAIAAPMTVILPDGTYGGPNLIPLQNLADELGVTMRTVPTTWNSIIPGLLAGQYDFAANLDKTERRSRAIDFTEPVYTYQGVFVIRADAPQNASADVLASGRLVATIQGNASENALRDTGGNILPFDSSANSIQAVIAGRAVAEFVDLPTAESQVQQDTRFKIIVPDPPIYDAQCNYGIVKQVDQSSRERIDAAISAARADSSLTEAMTAVGYFEVDNLGSMQKGS
ncbi:substrate-binding periplasmic protein [Nocardia australiensis]|uniref:substrate-binding periplasmic protein n=1 Tax=Nocardia australiensis TaxID=2887191 RepID=UPI001D14D0EC|nr:ABC transporter substrate-binding protein [Nocardia australiensis]